MNDQPVFGPSSPAYGLRTTAVVSGPAPPEKTRRRRVFEASNAYLKKPPVIDLIFLVAAVVVVLRKFASLSFDNRIGVTGSDLIYTLASAYVTGWIFYLIVTRYPTWTTKRKVYESVASELSIISGTARAVLVDGLLAASENPYGVLSEPPLEPDREYVDRVFATFNVNLVSITVSDDLQHWNTWNEHLYRLVTSTEERIRSMSPVYLYLPSSAVAAMNSILHSQFGAHCYQHMRTPPIAAVDFTSQTDVFMTYWKACFELLHVYAREIEPFTRTGHIYRWDVTTRANS